MCFCKRHHSLKSSHTLRQFFVDRKHDPLYSRNSVLLVEQGKNPSKIVGTAWEDDVTKAIKDHVCQNPTCKRIIKKGEKYLRRSFGQMWTIKACSVFCFERLASS